MKREEEIEKAAIAYVHSNVGYTDHWGYKFEDAFKAGVEWADKHSILEVKVVDLNAAVERYVEQHKSEFQGYVVNDST